MAHSDTATSTSSDGRELYPAERRSRILALLERTTSVQVADIAQLFGVSKVTARGDLDALERDGKLRRTHGGAVALSRTLTVSIQDRRMNVNVESKRAIAKQASSYLQDGCSVLVDTGTTALELVKELEAFVNVTVITADITIADYVDRSLPMTDVILLGGSLRKGHRYTTGPLAQEALRLIHPDICFISPTSYVPGRGFMTGHQGMAELKRAFLHCAEKTIVLLDSSKVNAPGLLRFGGPEDADVLIVDSDPEGVVADSLASLPRPVDLVIADAGEEEPLCHSRSDT